MIRWYYVFENGVWRLAKRWDFMNFRGYALEVSLSSGIETYFDDDRLMIDISLEARAIGYYGDHTIFSSNEVFRAKSHIDEATGTLKKVMDNYSEWLKRLMSEFEKVIEALDSNTMIRDALGKFEDEEYEDEDCDC